MENQELLDAIRGIVREEVEKSEQRMTGKIAESEQRMTERMTSSIASSIAASEQRMTERMTSSIASSIAASEQRMTEHVASSIAASEQRMISVIENKVSEAEHRITKSTVALMDIEFTKKFNYLADAIKDLEKKIVPESRVAAVEDEVDVLKIAVRRVNEDVQILKKAN